MLPSTAKEALFQQTTLNNILHTRVASQLFYSFVYYVFPVNSLDNTLLDNSPLNWYENSCIIYGFFLLSWYEFLTDSYHYKFFIVIHTDHTVLHFCSSKYGTHPFQFEQISSSW